MNFNQIEFHKNLLLRLAKIHEKESSIVIYKREIITLQQEIDAILNTSKQINISGDIEEVKTTLNNELFYFKEIRKDIELLLDVFKKITEGKSFRIFFGIVKNNMCKRFHTDINILRLLCTYHGPGTLWIDNENVNRDALNRYEDNNKIIINQQKINQVPKGAIAIIKGAMYPDIESLPLVHKSPEIEKENQNRLLLRIDINDNSWWI